MRSFRNQNAAQELATDAESEALVSDIAISQVESKIEERPAIRVALRQSAHETKVFDAIAKGKELVEAAKRQAESIVERARNEADEIRATAERDGYSAGRNEALLKFWQRVRERFDLMHESRNAILQLSTRVAEEVIASELQEQPQSILQRIARAMRQVPLREQIIIEVHSSKLSLVQQQLAVSGADAISSVRASDELGEHDARLIYGEIIIDAPVSQHLQAISSQLHKFPND